MLSLEAIVYWLMTELKSWLKAADAVFETREDWEEYRNKQAYKAWKLHQFCLLAG